MTFINLLNDAQKQAVTAPLQPMLVLAGPGTGKTRTLVARILYLIRHHELAAHTILAVTFTNKAKEEMKHRLREELGDAASDLIIGTFHRFCMNVLREHYERLALPKKFGIADEATQLLTLARVSRIQDARSVRTVLNAISSYRLNKDNLNPGLQSVAEKWMEPYHQELRRNALIDFDQILLFTRTLFKRYPLLVDEYRQAFTSILVDEFQDTDPIQYGIMKALAWKHRNIFVVADDDQSIFAWRGAHIENIDQYVKDFKCQPEQVIILDQNYRSGQGIIDVATLLINCGPRFREKQINAASAESGVIPAFHSFQTDEEEMVFILEKIQAFTSASGTHPLPPSLEKRGGENLGVCSQFPLSSQERGVGGEFLYSDIAVLYPTHAIGELLEARLLAAHIPCQLIRRQGIFDREEVQKLLLLLKLLQNSDDDLALEQFFKLELRNDVAFQQIQAFKGRNRTFRRTLYNLLSQPNSIAGIAQGALQKTISTTFGTISNMISYIEHNPNTRLPELVNMLCTMLASDETTTIYSHAKRLYDSIEIPGLPEAVQSILDTREQQGTLYICTQDPVLREVGQYFIHKAVPSLKVAANQVGSTSQVASTLESTHELVGSTSQAASTLESTHELVGSTSQVTSTLHKSHLFLCLDEASTKAVHASFPDISASQIVALTSSEDQQEEQRSQEEIPFKNSDSSQDASRITHHASRITSPFSAVVTLFKLAQALTSTQTPRPFRNYVVFDLETTSGDIRTTRIVEIGATKVRNGKIVGEFSRLVNPEQPITQGAYNVHHISEDDVRDQPTFAELLPEFLEFIGNDMLVAHNGLAFDFPITLRQCKEVTGQMLPNRRFDTLPLARRLFPGQPASVDALMERFGIEDIGGRHRALDDTIYLAQIFERLQKVERSVNRRAEHEELLELVALGVYLERFKPQEEMVAPSYLAAGKVQVSSELTPEAEEVLLFQLGARKLLSRFSELPEQFQSLYADHQLDLEILFQDFFEHSAEDDEEKKDLELVFSGREIALSHLRDVAETFKDEALHEAIRLFLDHAALYNSQDDIRDVNAVNLLTIHSAKGLEFPVVFVSGVEKGNLPSFYSVREEGELRQKKLDEQRRLFYVALTRAKQHLFVTYVDKRGEFDKKRSQFLVELGVESEDAESDDLG